MLRWGRRGLLFALNLVLVAAGVSVALRGVGPGAASEPTWPSAPLPERSFDVGARPIEPVPAVQIGDRPSEWGVPVADGCDVPVGAGEIVIPELCVQAPIVPTERPTGEALRIPSDVHEVGWWDGSAPVTGHDGSAIGAGTTLLVGHVSVAGQGPGALFPLAEAERGTAVYVSDASGTVTRWRIVSLRAMPKDELPVDVFAGPEGERRLVMVTCGGPVQTIDGHRTYRDNVVAVALPDTVATQ